MATYPEWKNNGKIKLAIIVGTRPEIIRLAAVINKCATDYWGKEAVVTIKKMMGGDKLMSKRVYISADYAPNDGDQEVIDVLHSWGSDNKHKTDFIDTAQVVSGSVSEDEDCRYCDLKLEFNRQINASSAVIFVIGDKTAYRTAGSGCQRHNKAWYECTCTPYKQNTNGTKQCKVTSTVGAGDNVGSINPYSFLRHEFEQAKKREKPIIIVYNSMNHESSWLPEYMRDYEDDAHPFWTKDAWGNKVGDYQYIKAALGYD